jgi:hypothetical protein
MRYHRLIFSPEVGEQLLLDSIRELNSKMTTYSDHALDKLFDLPKSCAQHAKDSIEGWLDVDSVFEYYKSDGGHVNKICFRIQDGAADGIDIIFVLNRNRSVVTLFLNNKSDTHKSLNYDLYEKE